MIAPSSISTRRFPDPVRVELQVAYARAWEALTATHEAQAVAFVRHLRGRLGSDEALHRYFREVAVPMQMQETVRARALLAEKIKDQLGQLTITLADYMSKQDDLRAENESLKIVNDQLEQLTSATTNTTS